MGLRKLRASDNGETPKYKRSLLGDTREIIKLLIMSGVIGGVGTGGVWFTSEEAHLYRCSICRRHLSALCWRLLLRGDPVLRARLLLL